MADALAEVTYVVKSNDYAHALALQADGKIVVAGSSWSSVSRSHDFALARYRLDGGIDTSFGKGGRIVTAFGASQAVASAVALQADGKIVVAGDAGQDTDSELALARYHTDGSLDNSFGGGGKVVTPLAGGSVRTHALTLQGDGGIVVIGSANQKLAVIRYNADGSLDTNFGTGGKVATTMDAVDRSSGSEDAHSRFSEMTLQPDGKIMVAGSAEKGFAVFRYNADGSLDPRFGASGTVITRIGAAGDSANTLALQPDGKIVVAGSCANARNSNMVLFRYNPDGSLDPTFGAGGKVTARIGAGYIIY